MTAFDYLSKKLRRWSLTGFLSFGILFLGFVLGILHVEMGIFLFFTGAVCFAMSTIIGLFVSIACPSCKRDLKMKNGRWPTLRVHECPYCHLNLDEQIVDEDGRKT